MASSRHFDSAPIVKQFRRNELDTGSPEVQIALLTHRINSLTEHFKSHAKDQHSRRGLIKMVGRRRRLLEYLKEGNLDRYKKLISDLELRK